MRISVEKKGPWLLLGDFDEILSNEEKRGGVIRSESSFAPFRNMLNVCGLMEVAFQGNDLFWFGFRSSCSVHCKLERVVANIVEWHSLFPSAKSRYLPRVGSYHSPIFTCLDGEIPRSRGSFRFDRRWIKERGFFR